MKCSKKRNNKSLDIDKFFRFLSKRLKHLGVKLAYSALLLFYAYQRKETPKWAKHIILGALAYLLNPFDAIPDLSPILGFTDDFGVMSFGLVTIACYINDDIRIQAKEKINKLFKDVDEEDLLEVDATL